MADPRELIGKDDSTEMDQVPPASWDDDGVGEVDVDEADTGALIENELRRITGAGPDSWTDPLKTDMDHTERPEAGLPDGGAAIHPPESGLAGGADAVLIREAGGAIVKRAIGMPDD